MKRYLLIIVAVAALACGQDGVEPTPEAASQPVSAPAQETLSVYTVNYPMKYFVERIGGDAVEVTFPAPADVDPVYWAPGPEVIAEYQRADLIVLNGVDYAKWLNRASLPASKLVNSAKGFEERWIPLEEGPVHTHGPEGEHSHKGYAFTTWLDPQLAIAQMEAIGAALIEAMPDREAEIVAALEGSRSDWQGLDSELAAIATEIATQPILFSHPIYQYLEARYGLNGRSLHWEPEEMPSEEQWQELAAILADHPAQWMIWEGQPAPQIAGRLGEMGVRSAVFEPCANAPETGDLLSVMQQNVAEIGRMAAGE